MKYIRTILILFIGLGISLNGLSQKRWNPKMTEIWEPVPRIVHPGNAGLPPSDAIVLFDGKHTNEWMSSVDSTAVPWTLSQGVLTVKKGTGDIQTKRKFGDIQLHIEWRTPKTIKGTGQMRGNSGIFLQNRYEVQVLDSYHNKTYSNGQAGAVYKQYIPLVNACRKPGEWQTYDIIYHVPLFNDDGIRVKAATLTVFHNGVLIQDHVAIQGTTEYIGVPKNKAHGKAPIKLQDHGTKVSYRNIWLRKL